MDGLEQNLFPITGFSMLTIFLKGIELLIWDGGKNDIMLSDKSPFSDRISHKYPSC